MKHRSAESGRRGVAVKPWIQETVRNHHIGKNDYVESEVPRWLEFNDESQLQYCLHVHRIGFSLKKAQAWLTEKHPGIKVRGIRSCRPSYDISGNGGSVLVLETSI